jgi:tRNA threonylcarbamoyladenosine biosynthesis protein TsaB
MIILGTDTSTSSLTVSLINDRKILASYNSIGTLKHSALLIPTIQKALRRANIKIGDINLFSTGLGPGSFTGLKVGVTAMRGLAIALNKPILGIPTMDAIAHNGFAYLKSKKCLSGDIKICPILDAKRTQVYACIYKHNGDKIVRESDYLLEPVETLVKRLRNKVFFLGDATTLYKEKLVGKKSFKAHFLDGKTWIPKGSVIAKIAFKEYQKRKSDNPYDLVPMYLYARDCNVRK